MGEKLVRRLTTMDELKAMTLEERRQRFRDGLVTDLTELPDWYVERIHARMDATETERRTRDAG